MAENTTDLVFHALANRQRREILDIVRAQPGCTISEVAQNFDCSRIAIMKHLNVLYEAELLLHEKIGRSRHLHLNIIPLQLIYDRWTNEYANLWDGTLAEFKCSFDKKRQK